MDKSTKYILLAGGAYLAWRAYSLNKLSNKIDYSPSGAKIDVDKKSRKITLTLLLKVTNPTQVNVTVTDTFGKVVDAAGNTLGTFNTGTYDIVPGDNTVKIPVVISGLGAFLSFSKAIASKKLPVVTIQYTNLIGALPVSDKITFDLSKANNIDMSVGNISRSAGDEPIKTSGIKTRGNGAATKGTMARGPLA